MSDIHIGIAIDPGESTGYCVFTWSDAEPLEVLSCLQFRGGAQVIAQVLPVLVAAHKPEVLVVEKFTPRQNEGFSHTRESVEPLRGEGVLYGLGLGHLIQWAEPSQQYFMGGETLPDKKKRSREFLKRHGLHLTGRDVGEKDANDAISAQLHAIAWLRRKRHIPTINALFGGESA